MFQFPFGMNPFMGQMRGVPTGAAPQLTGGGPSQGMAAMPPQPGAQQMNMPAGSTQQPQGIFQQLMGGQQQPPMGPGAQTPATGQQNPGLQGIFQQLAAMKGQGGTPPAAMPPTSPGQIFPMIPQNQGGGMPMMPHDQNPQQTPGWIGKNWGWPQGFAEKLFGMASSSQ